MDKIREGLFDLDHGLTTAYKLPSTVLKDFDLVPAYLAEIYFVDLSHGIKSVSGEYLSLPF